MIFSFVALIVFSSNYVRFVNAFEIGIPEIPFLNFNFNLNGDSTDSVADSVDHSDKGMTDTSNTFPLLGDGATHMDNSQKQMKTTDEIDNHDDFVCEVPQYDSLPFPSFVNGSLNNCKESQEQDERDNGLKELYTKMPFTLPLIADYSDIPSTFLSGTKGVPTKVIPDQ